MIKTEKKLSIFLNLNKVELDDFLIAPNGIFTYLEPNQIVYTLDLNINVKNKIVVNFNEKRHLDSYLHIFKIRLGDIELNHFDSYCKYFVNGKIKKTYGWIDEVGSCIINIHSNAVSQNLLLYLLSNHE
jgi:hypothetical protein